MARKGLLRQNNQAKTAEPKKRKGLLRQNSVSTPKKDEPLKEETHKRKGMIRQRLEEEKAVVASLALTEHPSMIEPLATGNDDIFRHINSETVIALKSDVSGCAQETTLTSGVNAIRQDIANIDFDTTDTHATSAANRSYDNYSLLTSATNGLADIKTKVDTTDTHATSGAQLAKGVNDIVSNQTYGLNAIYNYISDNDYGLPKVVYDLYSINGLLTGPNGIDSIAQSVYDTLSNMNYIVSTVDSTNSAVTDSDYGNEAIKGAIDNISFPSNYATSAQASTIDGRLTDANTGLSAIKNSIAGITIPTDYAKEATVVAASGTLVGKLDGTYGLQNIYNKANNAATYAYDVRTVTMNATYGNSAIKNKLDTTDTHATSAAQQAKKAFDIVNDGACGNAAITTKLNSMEGVLNLVSQDAFSASAWAHEDYKLLTSADNGLRDIRSSVSNALSTVIDNQYFGLVALMQAVSAIGNEIGNVQEALDIINGEVL